MHQQVLAKMNGDRPYFEARGAWKDAYFEARGAWKKDIFIMMAPGC